MQDTEFETQFENQAESFFGGLGEGESELETLGEGEYEGEQFIGGLLSGLLGEGEGEFETLGEGEGEFELEYEGELEGEQFFGKLRGLAQRAAQVVQRVAPKLAKIAAAAAPLVRSVVSGPIASKIGNIANIANRVGNIANTVGGIAQSYLPIQESEGYAYEGESEAEFEAVMEGPMTEQQALGELMAAAAAEATHEFEAETQIGAATMIALSPAERQALRSVLASLNRGAGILARILRSSRDTAPFVRTIPTIAKRTAVSLRKQAANGRPINRTTAANTMARQTRKVLGSPGICTKALHRNMRATKAAINTTKRPAFSV